MSPGAVPPRRSLRRLQTVFTRSPRSRDGLALGAGVLLPLGFAPFGLWLLPAGLLAVLFWLLPFDSTRRACWRGWLFGVGFFGAGVSWVVESFQHSNVALPSAVTLTALMVMFLALFPALFARAARWAGPCARPLSLLALWPALWVLSEWGRGTVLTGFTFLQLGYSQVDSPLAGVAPLAGVYAGSWLVAVFGGALCWLLTAHGKQRLRACMLLAVLLIVSGAARVIDWTQPHGDPVEVAVVQGNIPQALKWRPEFRERTLDIYSRLTERHRTADLVVWPETALPGLYSEFEDFLAGFEVRARAGGPELLVGVPSRADDAYGKPRYFNSVVAVGSARALYHKRHLVPFGEYVPLQTLFQPLIDLFRWPVASFSHGDASQSTVAVAGQDIGVSVCFEIAFGKDILAALPAAGMLVNVSNDAWFGASIGPHQHLQIARWRARETGRYLVRGTNTGISAFIDTHGRVYASLPQFEEGSVSAQVQPMRGATPYVVIGDTPTLALAVLVIIVVAGQRLRRQSRQANQDDTGRTEAGGKH